MLTLFPAERQKILKFILDNPAAKIGVRKLARELRISPAHVSRTLKILAKQKLFKNKKLDMDSARIRILKTFFNIEKLHREKIPEKLKDLAPLGAGIYGSWANGTNYEDSDVDIWIKVDKHPEELKIATISTELRKKLGKNVQILVLTPERIKRLKKEDPIFYYSLVFGSIKIYGETIE
ncbi:MAG: nucleotidyltransferase domain-containing protein [Candidatus Thermoplasmatota archaeon]